MRPFSSAANIGRSVSHGLSTSFGSLCLSGFVDPILQEVKSFSSHNLAFFLLTYCALGASLLEAISKFAVVSMAITGKSFIGSGRSVTAVLRRNLLSSVAVWTFPPIIMTITCLALAVVWGLVVIASAGVTWSLHPQGQLVRIKPTSTQHQTHCKTTTLTRGYQQAVNLQRKFSRKQF